MTRRGRASGQPPTDRRAPAPPAAGGHGAARPRLTRAGARRLLAAALGLVLSVAAAVLPAACSPAARLREAVPGDAGPPAAAGGAAVTRHVVIVSIDGLGAAAVTRYRPPALRRLMREGRASLAARTVLPSKTLPSHTSMLTGLPPERHGLTWNDDRVVGRGLVPVPTAFALARTAGLRTAAFFGKAKFRHLMVPGTLDYAQAPTGWWGRWSAPRTVRDVRRYLAGGARPNLLFVHLGEPDFAGHALGWTSWLYRRGVRTADAALGQVVAAADRAFGRGQYTLIVTADHGGHGRDHGSADPRDVTIPWIAWGKGVEASGALPTGIRTIDTAATALWLLGVPVPEGWAGRPVTAAFRTAAEAVTGPE